MGSIHYLQHDFNRAKQTLTRFLRTSPGHGAATKLLGAAYLRLNDASSAAVVLERGIQAAPNDPQLLAMLGSAYIRNQRFEAGLGYLEKAAKLAPDAAAIRTQLALGLLASGDDERGVAELSAAGETQGFFWDDFLLSVTYLHQRDYDNALASAEKLAANEPANPVPYNLMGVAYEGKGDLTKAREAYEKALSQQPQFITAALNLARMELWAGEMGSALARYESILKQRHDHPKALIGMAAIVAARGDIERGVSLLERARKSDPLALQPHLVLAEYFLGLEMYWEALRIAEDAHELAPDNPRAQLNLGRSQLGVGHVSDALETLSSIIKRYPQAAIAHYYLALAQARAGDTASPRSSLQTALELKEDGLAAQLALGRLELGAGNLEAAARSAASLQRSHPKSPAGFVLHGEILMAGGKPAEAVASYEAAFERLPSSTLLAQVYAAYAADGRYAEADAALVEWLSKNPADIPVRLVLANSHLLQGNLKKAMADYERILKQGPDTVVALNSLAWLYHQGGDERAIRLAARAHEVDPKNPDVLDTYGWLLVQTGDPAEGVGMLQRAVDAAPSRASIRYHLGAGLVRWGDIPRARKELITALETDNFSEREDAQSLLDRL